MSRFQGYVGVANFMGGRFVATDAAMQPIVKEAARRGLAWLDDGSVPRSVAGVIAEGQAMPFAKADVSIDHRADAGRDRPGAGAAGDAGQGTRIGSVLSHRRCRSRSNGSEPGRSSSRGRGIMLVPLTTAMLKPNLAEHERGGGNPSSRVIMDERLECDWRARRTGQGPRVLAVWRVTTICPTGPASESR